MSDVLVSHAYFYQLDAKQWKNKTPYPPLGTLYAVSYLKENGFSVSFFDNNLKEGPDEITPTLIRLQPTVFVLYDDGFNYLTKMCLTDMRAAAFKMIETAKSIGAKVVVSSSDSTDHYEMYLNAGADVVINGEGEISLKAVINSFLNNTSLKAIDGIMYKSSAGIVKQPKRSVLKELDQLPLPAWDVIDVDAYKNIWKQSGKTFTLNMVTTRGCPFKCNWCAKPIYGNRYNSHSPAYVVKHIKHLYEKFNVSRFWMCDDIFGLKPNWVQEFNSLLKKEDLSIRYYIQSRADLLLKSDTIAALAESGLEEVWIGAESGSQTILDAMDKGITVAQIYESTRLLKAKQIKIAFFIQFGYLGETKADIDKTIAMITELVPDNIGVSVSYPLPGTKFYDKVKEDLNVKANWTDSDDLAMMFKGTFNAKFYKKLHRYVHKEYRKSQGLKNLKRLFIEPSRLTLFDFRQIVLLGYYILTAKLDKMQLKNMEQKHD